MHYIRPLWLTHSGEKKDFEVYSCHISPDGLRLVTAAGGNISTRSGVQNLLNQITQTDMSGCGRRRQFIMPAIQISQSRGNWRRWAITLELFTQYGFHLTGNISRLVQTTKSYVCIHWIQIRLHIRQHSVCAEIIQQAIHILTHWIRKQRNSPSWELAHLSSIDRTWEWCSRSGLVLRLCNIGVCWLRFKSCCLVRTYFRETQNPFQPSESCQRSHFRSG